MEEAELNKKRVFELRLMLKDLGLQGSGTKPELIKRLLEHYNNSDAKSPVSNAAVKEEGEVPAKEASMGTFLQLRSRFWWIANYRSETRGCWFKSSNIFFNCRNKSIGGDCGTES